MACNTGNAFMQRLSSVNGQRSGHTSKGKAGREPCSVLLATWIQSIQKVPVCAPLVANRPPLVAHDQFF